MNSPADGWDRSRFCRTITRGFIQDPRKKGSHKQGWTELTVAPTDPLLRKLKLNCRQCGMVWLLCRADTICADIKNVTVNKREAFYEYNDVYQTRQHEGSTVHQHHQLRKRLREITKLDWGELAVTLPKQVKIEAQVPSST